MTFLEFISNLPFGDFTVVLVACLTLLVALGVYKFVKDWLPW